MPETHKASRFELDCPDCNFDFETDDVDEAVQMAAGHHDHTGHDLEWLQADWDSEFGTGTVWEVHCSMCGATEDFRDEDDLEQFQREHARYTDHELTDDDIRRRDMDTIDDLIDGIDTGNTRRLKPLIFALEERNERGAPYAAVVAVGTELGLKTSDIIHDLDKLMQRGELYEPTKGYLRTT